MFDRIVDRTRSRLDVPTLRTLFGAIHRPSRHRSSPLSLQLAAMIETPRYDLTLFKVHFGLLTLKAYTKGEHVLRFEAITHNTKQLRCGRTTKVHTITGQTTYTTRQAAYDLRKLRGKDLIVKPGRARRYHLPSQPARIITVLLTLREQVIDPILAGLRSSRRGGKPATWTRIDRDYETLRVNMQTLFHGAHGHE